MPRIDRTLRATLCCAGLVLGGISPLGADEQPPPPVTADPATVAETTDEEAIASTAAFSDRLVVTASLAEEAAGDLPATVHVVEAEEIAARQTTSLYDLASTLPGVQGTRLGSPGQQASIFVRGTESDHLLVLWNGVPLNNPYFGGFNWAFLGAEGGERLELVPGPSSALYGSHAVGGVLQIVTTPAGRPGAAVAAQADEHGASRLSGNASGGREKLAWSAHGFLRRGDGELPNDRWDGHEMAARLAWAPSPRAQAGLVARTAESDTGIPVSLGGPASERRIGWDEWQVALPVTLTGERWLGEGLVSELRTDSAFRDPDSDFSASDTDSRARRARAVATRDLGPGWWAAGGEVERLEVTDSSNFGRNLDAAHQRTWAVFTQAHLEGARWSAQLGVRHDDNDVFGSATSPRLGVTVLPRPWLRLAASYGEGFRAPSLGELFYPFFGNPDLVPEESASGELGATVEGRRWSVAATAFRTDLTNLVDFDESFVSFNVGAARIEGVETVARWRVGWLDGRLDATFLEAEDEATGLPLRRRAKESGHLLLVARPAGWTVAWTSTAVGDRPDIDPATGARATNPSSLRHDVAVAWRWSERLEPFARVENLAGERYQEALGYPAPGRTLSAGVRIAL